MTLESIPTIEIETREQRKSYLLFDCRKGAALVSKVHEVFTEMEKVRSGGYVSLWTLHKKILGLAYINLGIPALMQDWAMATEAIITPANATKTAYHHYGSWELQTILWGRKWSEHNRIPMKINFPFLKFYTETKLQIIFVSANL